MTGKITNIRYNSEHGRNACSIRYSGAIVWNAIRIKSSGTIHPCSSLKENLKMPSLLSTISNLKKSRLFNYF